MSDPSLRFTLKHHKSTPLFVQSSLMLSYFREFLKMSDQIRGAADHQSGSEHPDAPLLLVEMQPTCQSARGILRLVVETRGKRSRLGGSGVFRLGAVAAFLHVSLSSSADVSLRPLLPLSLSPHPFPFPVPQAPMGLSDSIVDVSLMSCPQMLRTVCLARPSCRSASSPITHFSAPHRC